MERSEMNKLFSAIVRDARGAAAIDYALIAALVVIGLVAVFGRIGDGIGNSFGSTANQFSDSEGE